MNYTDIAWSDPSMGLSASEMELVSDENAGSPFAGSDRPPAASGRTAIALDLVIKRPFILTDIEDRALAACDDMYLETKIAQNVLSTWYERVISFRELRLIYGKLVELGLLRTYGRCNGRTVLVAMKGSRTDGLSVRATKKGRQYLGWKRHVEN